jgi:NitT/TauT family transport system substrate-binding protein
MDKKIMAIIAIIVVILIAIGAYFVLSSDDGIVTIGYLMMQKNTTTSLKW